jgi:hypothetical protein
MAQPAFTVNVSLYRKLAYDPLRDFSAITLTALSTNVLVAHPGVPARSLKDLGGRRRGMQAMLDYLVAHPEKGLLGYEMGLKTIVQYWRSFEQLEAFAKDADDPHLEAWRDFWRRVGKSGRTGIWHETFLVRAGEYEAIYGNMPDYGLGKASEVVTVAEGRSARDRLRAAATT